MLDLWYKNAIIYCLDVDSFQDADGNGIGDFKGLIGRLDYLAGLGVTCIWLQPVSPSPNRDDGYDIVDYYGIDQRLGDPGDFVEFTHQAQQRGMRVLIDLVVNHTSDQHPWFQAARADPDSRYRGYYVWSEDKPKNLTDGIVFPGVQEAVWTHDRKAGAWYYHRFYKHQPDLNIDSPAVRAEIQKVMGYWLELGVSGFRIDAAPFLIERVGDESAAGRSSWYEYLRELREFLSWRRGDAILLAEANVAPDEYSDYFGDGTRLHMLFNFFANQHLFLALARREAEPLYRAYDRMTKPPMLGQWANFVRNHDELDLGRLSEFERQEVFRSFAPEKRMQLYGRGIRRRLPPMLGGERALIELAYSLMFSLPGTPVLRYGEEIGMGEDLSLPERFSIRTPMQWSDDPNSGFSAAKRKDLIRPAIAQGPFGYPAVNVEAQQRDGGSLLNWTERLIRTRRDCPELGWGAFEPLRCEPASIFAHRCDWNGCTVVAVHNLGGEPVEVALPIDSARGPASELFSDRQYPRIERLPKRLELGPCGYRWLRIGKRV